MRLDAQLSEVARRFGNKTAFQIVGGESISFAELQHRASTLAGVLRERGVGPGDRVGMVSKHDIDALVLFFAILSAGAIIVWLNDDAKSNDFFAVLDSADPTLICIGTERQRKLFADSTTYSTRVVPIEELAAGHADFLANTVDVNDDHAAAAIIYTSGSSGRPKGVCLTHKSLSAVAHAVIEHMPITSDDSYLMVVPMHYVHGIMQLLVHVLAGATIYFQSSFVFPKKVVDAIRTTGVTGFSGVPFHFNALISRGALLKAELPQLRWMTVTGGKLAGSTIIEILDQFPSLNFHIAYGQTECSPRATALHPSRTRAKLDSVGSPIPGVDVLLLDDQGNPVAAGESGEVVIAGDNIMQGYWQDEEATHAAIDELGRLHTGDIGRIDTDGDLFLVGRKSAMIKSAGERIVPEEIERVLVAFPGVTEAVVVGVDDALLGQRVVAHLQSANNDEAFIASVRAHCQSNIPLARAPREYHCWAEFPRKANGKPDRVVIASAKDPHERP